MKQPLSQNIQDYLKAIYSLNSGGEEVTTTSLAARLGVAAPSVTGMLQKLAALQPPLVVYQKHQGTRLTPEGERVALEVLRHHRLLETYLVESLGYSWDAVHDEACKLEHVISEEFETRIAAALGDPLRDPHGDLIPSANLTMPVDESIPLLKLRPGQPSVIRRVSAQDTKLLQHFESLGIKPGTKIEVTAYSEFDHNLTVKVGGKSHVLGSNITTKIFVEDS